MEIISKIIPGESLARLYEKLRGAGRTYAPVAEGDHHAFKYNPEYAEISYDYIQTVQTPKNIVFPRVENLFNYKKSNEGDEITDIDRSQIGHVVVWAAHPCDALSFQVLKKVFVGEFSDAFFKERMQKITVIGLSCYQADSNCFCTSVKTGPGDVRGSDILLTKLNDGNFLAEIITERGKEVFEDNAELFLPSGEVVKEDHLARVKVYFDVEKVTANLGNLFEHPFWVENSLRCIGCGACTYVCPICSCFDIQDEKRGKSGTRLRCWDSCGTSLFTMHASGHNPREIQSQRWRQRIMHKFSYQPESIGTPGCVGCGRCSRACSVDMNILEQLIMLETVK